MPNLIPLTRGMVAIVDDEDYDYMRRHRWSATPAGGRWYAARKHRGKHLLMHRTILDAPVGVDVDHKNGNGLDNRRVNLRLATRSQNTVSSSVVLSSSGYRGVDRHHNQWRAYASRTFRPGLCRHVVFGYSRDLRTAAIMRDVGMSLLFGEFAQRAVKTSTVEEISAAKEHITKRLRRLYGIKVSA